MNSRRQGAGETESFLLWKSVTCWRKDEMTNDDEKQVPGKKNKMDESMAFEKVVHFFFYNLIDSPPLVIIIYHASIVISHHIIQMVDYIIYI